MGIISSILDYRFASRAQVYVEPLREVRAHFDDLLLAHVKKNQKITESYGIGLHVERKTHGHALSHPEIYWETQFGLVLYARGVLRNIPIAAISFENRSTHLFVLRLHEVNGAKAYLHPLQWGELLYCACIEFSRALGLGEVRVCPAYRMDCHPFGNQENADGLTLFQCFALEKRLHLFHDVIPQKCGFRWDECTSTHKLLLLQ